uniref:Tudor domain containing 7 b n=1 Tax=Callorhinchus milii TaxID=7868 RepID=A0A4W3I4X5_CALMI
MSEAEKDLVAKMLRAVLQSSKDGVALTRLQTEYKQLTGELISHKQLGFPTLESYLKSMPSVVKFGVKNGEVISGLGREFLSEAKVHTPIGGGTPKDASVLVMQFHFFQTPGVWSESVDTGKSNLTTSKSSYNAELVQSRLKEILNKYTNGVWVSKYPQLYKKMFNEELHQDVLKQLETWTHICTVEKSSGSGLAELLLYPAKSGHAQRKGSFNQKTADKNQEASVSSKPVTQGGKQAAAKTQPATDTDIKENLIELLQKYSSGLWANALPKLFEETYKMQFPQNILDNLDCLSEICTVDYAVSGDRKKAILYAKIPSPVPKINEDGTGVGLRTPHKTCVNTDLLALAENEMALISHEFTETCTVQPLPLPLSIPVEQFPSVLVVELNTTDEAVIRYIGPEYSGALEQIEDAMKEHFTNSDNPMVPLNSQSVGQLVAVSAEEDSWLRAQIVEVEATKVKVFFVDHGFNEIVDRMKLHKLDGKFCSLPFQAAKCKLAGLEPFCKEPCVLESFETLACGKILLMEILERREVPLVLLYDTSGDDDFNINTACLKALHYKTLELNLKENGVYLNVVVTNVCSDGTIYCQVPSKGWNRLNALLDKVEYYFNSRQITSEYFVSLPFCGKRCLARSRGKWARVEITNVHGTRVVDVMFLDTGTVASVAVSELREIPSPFLQESVSIPPQAIKCCLADLTFNIGMWTPDAVLWLRDTVLNCSDCSIKIVKVDDSKGLVHIYLFTSKNFPNPERSINHKITNADLWKHQKDVYLSSGTHSSPSNKGDANITSEFEIKSPSKDHGFAPIKPVVPLFVHSELPTRLVLPQPGEHLDVFISVACHPGHFVFQPWQELYKLEVLMEEMILYYNRTDWQSVPIEKNKIFAAQLDNKWYRVLVKGILTNGLVSVYQLDYGRHELVSCRKVQTLVQQFRQLPFQAVTAQLAGVKCEQWSEETSIVFRNHVERKPLVAQIQAVHESMYSWDRKVVTYLVDTSLPDTDVWIHDLLTEYLVELSKVA